MFINGAHKHIHTHTPTTFHNSTLGCYRASRWQMPVSSPPERNHQHPRSGTGEFKRSRMRLRLSSFPPQWSWHLARATFQAETSTTKPVSPGAIIDSKSAHPWSRWLTSQSSVEPCFCSTGHTRKEHAAALTCNAGLITHQIIMYVFMWSSCK